VPVHALLVYNNRGVISKGGVNVISHLLIFDIDGTLMSCGGSGRKSMNDTFFEVFNIENGFDSVNMAGCLDRMILRSSLEIHQVQLEDEALFFSLYGHHLKKNLQNNPGVRAYSGVEGLLDAVASRPDVLCTVGTGNCEIGAYEKLKAVQLHDRFVLGGYGDHHDTRAQLIQHVIDQAAFRFGHQHLGHNTIVIGDTPLDIESGKAVGATTVAVATGNFTREQLAVHAPDLLLNDLTDSKEFLFRTGLSV